MTVTKSVKNSLGIQKQFVQLTGYAPVNEYDCLVYVKKEISYN